MSVVEAPADLARGGLLMDRVIEDDPERKRRCLQEAPLDLLRERGEESGLSQYLEEVQEKIAWEIAPVRGE